MNIVTVIIHVIIFLIFSVMIIGKIITISTSKMRNSTAIRKNCKENGNRAVDFGSNPHSNGDIFSRLIILFLEIIVHSVINTTVSVPAIIILIITFIITFSYLRSIDWKSIIFYYTKKVASSSVN